MINAKEEVLAHVDGKDVVKCAWFADYGAGDADDGCVEGGKWLLRENHSRGEGESLIAALDFDYNNGYGIQNFLGAIWYEDGTWSSSGAYDGSEWWEYNAVPDVPEDLKLSN